MAPTSAAISGCLRQVVYYHLDNFSYDSALFFAEKLSAQDPRSPESAYLLALSHYQNGDFRSAFEASRSHAVRGSNIGATWIFAQSCLKLERWREGINAIEKTKAIIGQKNSIGQHSASIRAPFPDLSSVLCLLGKLYRGYDDKKKAVSCFEDSLKANPMQWDAFTSLCDMGVVMRVPVIFKMSETLIHSFDPNIDDTKLTDNVLGRKNTRSVAPDPLDPFQTSNGRQDGFGVYQSENGTNDFMSKITAARSKLTSNSSNSMSNSNDSMDTPPTSVAGSNNSENGRPFDGGNAPSRRLRAHLTDASNIDGMPASKPSYRLIKRATRSQDKADQTVDVFEAPAVRSTNGADRKRTVTGHPVRPPSATGNHGDDGPAAPQRRSARLNLFRPTTSKTGGVTNASDANTSRELKKPRQGISRLIRPDGSRSTTVRPSTANRKGADETGDADGRSQREKELGILARKTEVDTAKIEESLKWLLDLLKKTANGYYELSHFNPPDAIYALQSIPKVQQETPWVISHLGKAQLEQSDFVEAEKCFRKLRSVAPTRVKDMELYSTVLWQLKREPDLSYLAHELIDEAVIHRGLVYSWQRLFSTTRSGTSLALFQACYQLNPTFAYAFTLQGHEHMDNEEYEKALTAYRRAISSDRRHYKAYFGIGQVYRKLGDFDRAFVHYDIAARINPSNPVLLCSIGTALEKQKNPLEALRYYSKATELFPKATDTRYKKARALMTLGDMEAAKQELLILKDQAPDEAPVHFLLGKLYRDTNQRQAAVKHFTNAQALDPKAALQIKEAIEAMEDDIPWMIRLLRTDDPG